MIGARMGCANLYPQLRNPGVSLRQTSDMS
jgi:hypothetical protein